MNRKEIFWHVAIILTFVSFIYFYTNFQLNFGSDDGTQYHLTKELFLRDNLSPASTLPQILYSIFFNLLEPSKWIYIGILINIVSLIFSYTAVYLIADYLFDKKVALLSSLLFLLTSTINIQYILRWSPYLMAGCLSLFGVFYFLKSGISPKPYKFPMLFLSSLFIISAILTRRIWQLLVPVTFLILVLIFVLNIKHYSRQERKSFFKKYFYLFLFIFLLFLPILIWRINILGQYFYLDEYTWFFKGNIARNYITTLSPALNPSFSLNNFCDYFTNVAYKFYPLISIGIIFVGFLAHYRQKKEILISLVVFFLIFLSLPVFSQSIRLFDRYSYPGFFAFTILLSLGIFSILSFFNTPKMKTFGVFIFLIFIFINLPPFYNSNFKNFDGSIENQQSYFNDTLKNYFIINSGGGNVLFRSYFIDPFLPKETRMYNLFNLEKEDAVNYLLWEDESKVIHSLEKYNITWIFIYNKETHLEEKYYGWTKEEFGKSPNYLGGLENSDKFIKVFSGEKIDVYKLYQNETSKN